MAFYLSPLVDVKEYDASTTIPAVATTIAVSILRDTYKGPELKTQFITSVDELIETFGKPTSAANCYEDILSATGYLKYGNMLYCTRALPTSAAFSGIGIDATTLSAATSASATYTGYTLAQMTTALRAAGASDDIDDFGYLTPTTGNLMDIVALSRGEHGNKIRVAMCGYDQQRALTNYVKVPTTTTNIWLPSAALATVDSPLSNEQSFLIIVQTVDQLAIPSTDGTSPAESIAPSGGGYSNWITQEIFNVSVDPDAYDDSGQRVFVEKLINETSKYIRVTFNSTLYDSLYDMSNLMTQEWIYLTGGIGGNSQTGEADLEGPIELALDLYQNPEEIDVNMFIDSNKSVTIKSYMTDICIARKDAMAILDCYRADVLANRGSETDNLKAFSRGVAATDLQINSSYAALYGNWIEVFDKWNGKYRWIPVSGHVAGLFANNDNVADPWYAPAGPNRAVITSVRRLAWNPSLGQRNILYKNGINPIVSLSGMGKMIYGQKTLLDKESAFNRINVRRLFMVLEKAISTAARYFLFEPNNDISRLLLINMIDPFLRDVKARQGLYDYALVCDRTNNTPERIDRGELYCDIHLKPTRASEFIVLNFIATKTGASFTEITGAVS